MLIANYLKINKTIVYFACIIVMYKNRANYIDISIYNINILFILLFFSALNHCLVFLCCPFSMQLFLQVPFFLYVWETVLYFLFFLLSLFSNEEHRILYCLFYLFPLLFLFSGGGR